MRQLENSNNKLFNKSKLNRGNLSYDEVYDDLRGFRKMKKPSSKASKGNKEK